MSRLYRAVAVAVPLLVAVAWFHIFSPYAAWAVPVHAGISIAIAAFAVATTWTALARAGRAQLAIAGLLQCLHVAIIGATLAGIRLIPYDLYPDHRLAVVVGAISAVATYGIARRRTWGRWLGMALGAVGAVSGAINVVHFWPVTRGLNPEFPAWSNEMYGTAWVMMVTGLCGLVIAVNLMSRAAREACSASTATWTADPRVARLVRPMLVTTFGAAPMLLVYAWLQPIVPATQTTAIVLAAILAIAATITVRGKLVGALALVIAGVGLLAQTAVTVLDAAPDSRGIAGYYAVFWLPAAVCAIVCGIRLAGPTWRLLRA